MRAGLGFLVAGYVLSQFYRAFLAVLAPVLDAQIAVGPEDLAISSGLWFLAFAVMQMPVGWALDRIGPRRTASVLLALGGGGGAAVFALAEGPMALHLAMVLIGIGCSPVLMASYYIFARMFPPAIFGTLAGAIIGVGSLGNIAGAAPLAALVELAGWRETLWGLAAVTLLVAGAIWRLVQDPPRAGSNGQSEGSVFDLLKVPGLWAVMLLMAVAYAPAAAVRGLWAGPYLGQVFGADAGTIGNVTLVMALAMVAGNFAYGPVDRIFRSKKWPVFGGNLLAAACLAALWLAPDAGVWTAAALLAGLGFFGASFPAIMSHARAFFAPHLVGRGVTFINMFGIGGAGLMQFASGRVFAAAGGNGGSGGTGGGGGADVAGAYGVLFLYFLVPLVIGLGLYLFSRDSRG